MKYIQEFEFLHKTMVAGRDKIRLRCPVCIQKGKYNSRFNVAPSKAGKKHKCRFCGSVLKIPKTDYGPCPYHDRRCDNCQACRIR